MVSPAADSSDSDAVLVVGPGWVGDMVMAQSLFKALRQEKPARAIDVITPPWGQALLERMPEVRNPIPLAVPHGEPGLGRRWKLGRALRVKDYTQAIILPRSAKAALIPWIAGIPRRTGYLGEYRYGLLNDIRPLDRQSHYRTVDRFVALSGPPASGSGEAAERSATGTDRIDGLQPALRSSPSQTSSTIQALGIRQGRDPADRASGTDAILTICPGAEYGPAKRWPVEHFASLARMYLGRGWSVWMLGSGKDARITQEISGQAPGTVDLAGRTTLSQAIDLLAASTVVVSNDSGLMHIAAATSTSLVALYGSSDPQYTPPLSEKAEIIYRGLDCSPCFQRDCPLGHLNCLRGITPQSVADAIDRAFSADADTSKAGP
ncbi:lipopolysaccharide heptosyltransferase II [Spiribacter sp. 221]|uniref:lipopolysaccharide heptosyltransferase II n=1 Tax=Spiribacter onubensis TaxID=3122420 RepID=UPI00349F6559